MPEQPLHAKTVMITSAARRLGRLFALACAHAGADIVIHHGHSNADAESLRQAITGLGRQAWVFQADLSDSSQTQNLIPLINRSTPIHYLINNAAIFESLSFESSSLENGNQHLATNLTAPFILSQAFARQAENGARIINILDWRALRPGADHFPYTISKSALAALTKSMAVALAPKIIVNEAQTTGIEVAAVLAEAVRRMPAPSEGRRDTRRQMAKKALMALCEGDDAPYWIEGDSLTVV